MVEGTSPSGPVATGSDGAVGTPVVGATLTAVLSNVTDPDGVGEFRFRWIAGDAEVPDETDETCLLREEELGNMVRVEVAYTDDLGKVKTLVSDPVGPVRAAPTPPPETPPTLTISPGPSPVVEGSAVEFTVRRSHAKTDLGALEVTISETGSMLTGVPPRAFRFAVGETTARLRLDTDNDEVNEAGSEVRATLAAGADYELGTPRAATVLVLDDDASPGLIVEPGTASEDAGMVELAARLTAPAGESLSVAWSTSDATAMAGVDYVESSGMLTFPVGATEERFSVGLIDDRIAEGNEYLLIMLRDAWTEVDESPIAVTILDDDPASANVELTLDRERVSEGEGPVALTVTAALDRSARGVDTAVEVALSGSGASGTVGYTAAADFVLTIPEGALSGAASFTLRPEDDRVDELDETIEVSGTSVLPVIPTSLLLEDDDEPSKSIVLAASPEVIAEDAGPTVVTVIGSLDLSARVVDTEVRIAVSGSRMSDVVGFEPVESFVLTIPAKQMSGLATFVLTPVNDMEEANSGTLEVQGEADLPVSLALLLLLDDDDASVARAWLSRPGRCRRQQRLRARGFPDDCQSLRENPDRREPDAVGRPGLWPRRVLDDRGRYDHPDGPFADHGRPWIPP